MERLLEGKSIVVTGAGRGIGRAIALASSYEGARVVVADNGVSLTGGDPSSDVAFGVAQEIYDAGGEAVAVTADVTQMSGATEMVQIAIDRWGHIDGVVAAAGILREALLFEMTEEEWDDVVATHLRGHFTVFRAASAEMIRQGRGGKLIGFTSQAMEGRVAMANYAAAKAGVASLVRSAAAGLSRYGITANAVAPLATTRMNAALHLDSLGEPEDVSPLVIYLLSDRAHHITGQVYTAGSSKIAVWNQPREVRAMYKVGRWTPGEIADRLDSTLGTEPMNIAGIDRAEEMRIRNNASLRSNNPSFRSTMVTKPAP